MVLALFYVVAIRPWWSRQLNQSTIVRQN